MKRICLAAALPLAGLLMVALSVTSCSKSLKNLIVPNQPPTVRLTSAPYDTTNRYFYAYKLNWIGDDPDGRVSFFVYAIDPPTNGDPIPWVKTTRNEQIVFFRATLPDPLNPLLQSQDFHVFAIRAVDNGGDSSDVVERAFFSYTVAPTVHIIDPPPNHLRTTFVTPSVRINWAGQDPDGQFTQKPIKYKFALITESGDPKTGGFKLATALASFAGGSGLDSLRRFFAPRFAGWDSSSAETTTVQYSNLTPNADYMFVVVAFDEAGAYSPIFSLDSNCLHFRVLLANAGGPKITMFNEFFTYSYVSARYSIDPSAWVFVEVPADQPITFNWNATTDPGADVSFFRWRLGGDVADETPRVNENTDIGRWSSPSINNTSATVGPFARDTVMFFYIESTDNNNLRSLGVIQFHVVKPTFEHALGVVNDTRNVLDVFPSGRYLPPGGSWPTAAELDTFLFARGGAPYRLYPAGTISQPGIFAPYDFDTVTTRTGKTDMTVPLRELGRFRNLIWITDLFAANKPASGLIVANAECGLRYMNNKNRVNTLATYVKQGGHVWLMGSGIVHASQFYWDKGDGANYTLGTELAAGRFMYDIVHWQNDIRDIVGNGTSYALHKSPRRATRDNWVGAPNYALMPDTLRLKSLALGDEMPPYRTGGFYQNGLTFSFLNLENHIIENLNPDLGGTPDEESTLDTLYNAIFPPDLSGFSEERPVATYYHGLQNSSAADIIQPGTVVFTAFDPWLFSKADFVPLVQFVVENVWKVRPLGAAASPLRGVIAAGARPGRPAYSGGARQLLGGSAKRGVRVLTAPPGHGPHD